jgi:uncharacterized protein YbjT (DUF2867 family)
MRLGGWSDRATFHEIDWLGHRNLIEAAREARVRKFVYASVAGGQGLAHTEYAASHEKTTEELSASGLNYTVVRLTGLYAFFGELLAMAAKGRSVVIGDGSARTNPIHESDLADFCARALDQHLDELRVGGPGTFTRSEIAALARHTVQRAGVPRLRGAMPVTLRLTNRRVRELLEFSTEISRFDILGEPHGRHELRQHLSALSGAWRPGHDDPAPLPRHGPLLALDVQPLSDLPLL